MNACQTWPLCVLFLIFFHHFQFGVIVLTTANGTDIKLAYNKDDSEDGIGFADASASVRTIGKTGVIRYDTDDAFYVTNAEGTSSESITLSVDKDFDNGVSVFASFSPARNVRNMFQKNVIKSKVKSGPKRHFEARTTFRDFWVLSDGRAHLGFYKVFSIATRKTYVLYGFGAPG